MPAFAIVEALDPVDDIDPCLGARVVATLLHVLDLERFEKSSPWRRCLTLPRFDVHQKAVNLILVYVKPRQGHSGKPNGVIPTLTDTAVRQTKAGQKHQYLFDRGGLYLHIAPSGRKWWRLKFRFQGKPRLLSLGVYPDVSLRDARDRRKSARKLLAQGIDPGEDRKNTKREAKVLNTFQILDPFIQAMQGAFVLYVTGASDPAICDNAPTSA